MKFTLPLAIALGVSLSEVADARTFHLASKVLQARHGNYKSYNQQDASNLAGETPADWPQVGGWVVAGGPTSVGAAVANYDPRSDNSGSYQVPVANHQETPEEEVTNSQEELTSVYNYQSSQDYGNSYEVQNPNQYLTSNGDNQVADDQASDNHVVDNQDADHVVDNQASNNDQVVDNQDADHVVDNQDADHVVDNQTSNNDQVVDNQDADHVVDNQASNNDQVVDNQDVDHVVDNQTSNNDHVVDNQASNNDQVVDNQDADQVVDNQVADNQIANQIAQQVADNQIVEQIIDEGSWDWSAVPAEIQAIKEEVEPALVDDNAHEIYGEANAIAL